MSFELRDHTADVAVEAHGATLDEAVAAVADGLAAAMCEAIPEDGERFELSVAAESREAVLFDYLDRLIYERDVRDVLPVENEASVTVGPESDEWTIRASARGIPLSVVSAREIKAVTYSEMAIERTGHGWSIYVVFDV